ncbi:MAG: DUF1801 domain-containing protein [Roseibium sp.]
MSANNEVLSVIDSYPNPERDALHVLRQLILDVAGSRNEIGDIEETLKWGQPSYLTRKPKSGTTIRIDRDASNKGDVALYVNCQTSLVSDWRGLYPHLTFGGDRSIHFDLDKPLPTSELRQMIMMALTYHVRKKS